MPDQDRVGQEEGRLVLVDVGVADGHVEPRREVGERSVHVGARGAQESDDALARRGGGHLRGAVAEDRVRTVGMDRVDDAVGNFVEGCVPADAFPFA